MGRAHPTHMLAWWGACILLAMMLPMLLAGCGQQPCPTDPSLGFASYRACLARYETLRQASQDGPFTILDLSYDSPGGYLFGSHQEYRRVLYRGHTVVERAERVDTWPGSGGHVLFSHFYVDTAWTLNLVYERADQAVVERLDVGVTTQLDGVSPIGFPWRDDTRYFPDLSRDNAGFLLRALPTRLVALPPGPRDDSLPAIEALAGVAPDGGAYAYADSPQTPSVLVVVDANGTVHAPMPVPLARLDDAPDRQAAYMPLWRWFAGAYDWRKNARGRWDLVARQQARTGRAGNDVEALFTNAAAGYATCFDPANRRCRQDWRPAVGACTGDDCVPGYAYRPVVPKRAFGAPVVMLRYASAAVSGSGYQLLLDAAPGRVAVAVADRLARDAIPFVRLDRCPDIIQDEQACAAELEAIGLDRNLETLVHTWRAIKGGMVFMTPTAAFRVSAAPDGRTWIATLARYGR